MGAKCGCSGECSRREEEAEQDSCRCELVPVDVGDLGAVHALGGLYVKAKSNRR